MILQKLLGLGFPGLAIAADCTFESISPSKTLTWCPCEGSFFCAKLDVPLDYQNPGLGRASVPLIKVPAQAGSPDGPYKGMILINPGGPGGSGITEARSNGSTIQSFVGTNFDVVGFDPRGIWLSEPSVNCSGRTGETTGSDDDTARVKGRSVPRVVDGYYQSFIDYGKQLGKQCDRQVGKPKDAGPHMTTAVTARDMQSIVDAFAKTADGKRAPDAHLLNYYGISYGTFLGQTFASMFPHRVGHVVLDGVVSPQGYLGNDTSSAVTHLDGVIALYFIYCFEAGTCPYNESSPKAVFERFRSSFVQLDARRAQREGWSNASDIETALLTLKVGLLSAADQPLSTFAALSDALRGLEAAIAAQDVLPWAKQVQAFSGDPSVAGYVDPEYTLGVVCSDQDNKLYGKTLKQLMPIIHDLERTSIIGEIWTHSILACTGWPIKSGDVFRGPFGGKTATPIVFVSNTYDPVTPIENGISSAPHYKDAQVLTVDGLGHTSAATLNLCAFGKLKAYFQDTQLPGKDNYCPLETGPFGITLNGTLAENIKRAGLSSLRG